MIRRQSSPTFCRTITEGSPAAVASAVVWTAAPCSGAVAAGAVTHGCAISSTACEGETAVEEESWCREFCRQRNIPFQSQGLHVPQQKQDNEAIEEAAGGSDWRLAKNQPEMDICQFFSPTMPMIGLRISSCRMARGGNSSGLTGMRSVRRVGKLLLCRRCSNCAKPTWKAFCACKGLPNGAMITAIRTTNSGACRAQLATAGVPSYFPQHAASLQ